MAADDLMNFPTPAEAFGRTNRRAPGSPSQSSMSSSRHASSSSHTRPQQLHRVPPPPLQHHQMHNPPPRGPIVHPQMKPIPQAPFPQGQRNPSRTGMDAGINHSQPSYTNSTFSGQQSPNFQPYAQQQQQQQLSHQSAPAPPQQQVQVQQTAAQVLERQLRDIFDRADRTRDGRLTEDELGAALLNNDGSQFKPSTLKLMIRLFDTDDSSTIEFKEFFDLWTYIIHWRKEFQRYDLNKNGKISFGEYQAALESFGYRLPTDIVLFAFQKFGDFNSNKPMSLRFDMFVESLIWLLRCTNIFKKFDSQGNGIATIPFQDFVHEFISFI